jgi:hypothetical protein
VPNRFGTPSAATQVSATGSYLDNFYISCPDTQIAASPSTSITVGYWVQITQFPNDGAGCTIGCGYRTFTILATTGDEGGCSKYLAMNIGSGGGGLPSACQGSVDGETGGFTSSTSVVDGNWHNLVWVFDNTNDILTFYLDGVQNSTGPLPGQPYAPQNTQFVAGAENGSFALNGALDDVWIENHAWTQGEVTRYYAGLSNTIDVSESAGKPKSAFMADLRQAGVANIIVKAPQPCPDATPTQQEQCQAAIAVAGEQFNAFSAAGFQVAAYCYLHFQTTSPTGTQQAQNCLAAVPQSLLTSVRFMALDVEETPVASQADAISIISDAVAVVSAGMRAVVYTNSSFWSKITGNTNLFMSYPLWTTGGEFQEGSQQYCGTGVPSLAPPPNFGGWTERVGRQYYDGPYTTTSGCTAGAKLFGVSVDFDLFEPSLF